MSHRWFITSACFGSSFSSHIPKALTTVSKFFKSSFFKSNKSFSITLTFEFESFDLFLTIAVTSNPLFKASSIINFPALPVAPIIAIFIFYSFAIFHNWHFLILYLIDIVISIITINYNIFRM